MPAFGTFLQGLTAGSPNDLLIPGRQPDGQPIERILYVQWRHAIYLYVVAWKPILTSLVLLVVLLRAGDPGVQALVAVALTLSVFWVVYVVYEWLYTRIMVTNLRVLVWAGFFRRDGGTMPRNRVTDLAYEQSLVGLLLGFAAIRVESAGQDQALSRLAYLRYPLDFQAEVLSPVPLGAAMARTDETDDDGT
jgi:uncharacterized membrane protein YdbT with pleckstrin-like domain